MVTDTTDAASWGIFDTQTGTDWLPGVHHVLHLPNGILPPVKPTGTLAGPLLPALAVRAGLPAGVPVAVAIGDNQASFLGSVPSLTECALFNLGTGSQLSVPTSQYRLASALETRPLIPGWWLLVGASLCGGYAYQLLADFFSRAGVSCLAYRVMNRVTTR